MRKTWYGAKAFGPFVLRMLLGPVFFAHGAQKLFGWFGGRGLEGYVGFFENLGLVPGKIYVVLVGGTEFVAGILVFIGLFARLGAFAIAH